MTPLAAARINIGGTPPRTLPRGTPVPEAAGSGVDRAAASGVDRAGPVGSGVPSSLGTCTRPTL